MTTIVYDHKNKIIACDSRLTADDVVLTDDGIKWKLSDDSIWFFTGNPADDEDLMLMKHNEKPNPIPNSIAIFVKDGDAWLATFDGDYCSHTKLAYNHAIGSGWKFALAALDLSLESEEAIKYASKRDCFTGGKVRVYDIKSNKFI